jgi:hypothetical protein
MNLIRTVTDQLVRVFLTTSEMLSGINHITSPLFEGKDLAEVGVAYPHR